MGDGTGPGTDLEKLPKYGPVRQNRPIPIWRSKLYRQRRTKGGGSGLIRERARRFVEGTLLQEKREFADRLFSLCDKADHAIRQRGGDVADELERVAELSFIVSYWDSETAPEIGVPGPFEQVGESRDYLAAMVLASEVARLAHESGEPPENVEDRAT